MCGIIGYTGNELAQPILLDGLRTLEYRGYDSSGISVLQRGKLKTIKAAGRLSALTAALPKKPLTGTTGIGHTRWATHGKPDDINAHPHTDTQGRFAIVHNGIIENAFELRNQLKSKPRCCIEIRYGYRSTGSLDCRDGSRILAGTCTTGTRDHQRDLRPRGARCDGTGLSGRSTQWQSGYYWTRTTGYVRRL